MATSIGSHLTRKKQHFPYEIAILCYTIPISVLTLLYAYRIPPQRITLFVQQKDDELKIQREILRQRYGRLIVGEQGAKALETVVHNHYAPGTLLVVLRDDCSGILDTTQSNKVLKSLLGLIRTGFEACKTVTSGFWGVYPIAEESFLRQTISSKLCYTSPVLWGCIVMPITFTAEHYTHYERILQYYKVYKKIIRINHISVNYTSTSKDNLQEATKVKELFPQYVSLYHEASGVHLRLHDSERSSKEQK